MYKFGLLLIILVVWLAAVVSIAHASAVTIKQADKPIMCAVEGQPIPCAYLLAVIHRARQTTMCKLHNCPHKI